LLFNITAGDDTVLTPIITGLPASYSLFYKEDYTLLGYICQLKNKKRSGVI
jgi:hypothetical protein